jgi:hypothetical protein
MFPILSIAIGIVVLALGKRLAVMGAAVGGLLGIGLLRFFPGSSSSILLQLAVPITLAVLGFFAAGFAKGFISIALLVIGALAGAAVMMGFCDLFHINSTLIELILVVVGALAGAGLIRRFSDWGMIILSGLVGGLLITRGLSTWLPVFDGLMGAWLAILFVGVAFLIQGGLVGKKNTTKKTT